MTDPTAWRSAQNPGKLYLALWRYVSGMHLARLAAASNLSTDAGPALAAALTLDNAAEAVAKVCDALDHSWCNETNWSAQRTRAALALTAMRAIDMALLAIHPRAIVPSAARHDLPSWLEDIREQRTLDGTYAITAELALIARGPFARSPRGRNEEATFVLNNQFAALKVVNLSMFSEGGRPLSLSLTVVDQSADRGVPVRRDRGGSEVVSFVPLAEASDDLNAVISTDEGTTYIDINKMAAYDPAARFLVAVEECADSDILIAPELTVDLDDVAAIASGLTSMIGARPRLLVAGSGLVPGNDPTHGFPFNQASIFNGHGALLWDHRKVSLYAMRESTSKDLTIAGAAGANELMERIVCPDTITVADIDGLGRCLVLICQDLVMAVVRQLLEEFRPDWVLVPILDSGTGLNRWPARTARDIATICEARFLVVSSLTMKHWLKTKYPGEQMGVAIGPSYTNADDAGADKGAQEAEVSPESSKRRHASLRWRSVGGWRSYR